jgi:hypothetical protein
MPGGLGPDWIVCLNTDKINQTLTNYLLEDDRDPSVSFQSQAR